MTKKNKDKVIYLMTKKAPLINLYSLPTTCPVCHTFQEPNPIIFKLNKNTDAVVQFCCKNDSCKTSFSAFYIKGGYGKEQYHFICFI